MNANGGGRRKHLGLAALMTLGSCALGQGNIQGRFTAVHNAFGALGISQVGRLSEGSLGEHQTARFPVDLEAQCYTFVAFGGEGARDVDLQVLDARDQRAAGENARDAQAVVRFCAPARGRYTLALRMADGGGSYLIGSWQGGARGGGGEGGVTMAAGGRGTCSEPIPIRSGETVTGTTQNASARNNASCLGVRGEEEGAPEVVYSITLERRQLVTVAVEQQGNYDGAVYIRSGSCEDQDSEVPGGCNDDDGDTSHSRVQTALEPGQYFIFVDGFGRNRGAYSMTVTTRDVPSAAEVCQNAQPLTPNTPVTGQLSSQELNNFQARCGANARGPDRVYRLEVPQESRLQLHQESDYDGVIYVRRACADASSEMECNDDAEDVQHARINTVLPAGNYYVFTDGYQANAQGNYTLQADLAPVAGGTVQGDSCTDAQPITPGTPVEGNTFQAHDDVASPCAAQSDGYDMVYRLNVTSRARVRLWFDANDIGEQGTITVTRNCAQVAQAQCRAGALGEQRGFDQVLDPGQYFVIVDSAQPRRFGRFRLNSRIEDAAAVERLCRTAPLLVPGRTVTGTTQGQDRFNATCAGGARSPENLYRLVLRRRSSVRLALTSSTPNFDAALYVRQQCAVASTERACNDDAGDQQHSLIETTLDAGTYTVFVDGFAANNRGSYSLDVQVTPQ